MIPSVAPVIDTKPAFVSGPPVPASLVKAQEPLQNNTRQNTCKAKKLICRNSFFTGSYLRITQNGKKGQEKCEKSSDRTLEAARQERRWRSWINMVRDE